MAYRDIPFLLPLVFHPEFGASDLEMEVVIGLAAGLTREEVSSELGRGIQAVDQALWRLRARGRDPLGNRRVRALQKRRMAGRLFLGPDLPDIAWEGWLLPGAGC